MALLWLVAMSVQIARAEPEKEALIFSQTEKGLKTLYLYETGQSGPVNVASGKRIKVFLKEKHFFYFLNRGLYEYRFATRQSKLLHKFAEDDIDMAVVAASNGLNQMIILGIKPYELKYYILDLNDDSVRPVTQPGGVGSSAAAEGLTSPDGKYKAVIKTRYIKNTAQLGVQSKIKSKYQDYWTLQSEQMVLPHLLTWSPDSKYLAVHAKKNSGYDGFYSFYCFNTEQKKLQLVSETVLYFDGVLYAGSEEFRPDWSFDSKYLVFERQPTGSPSQSEIVRYDVKTGKSRCLSQSNGQNQLPRFSPSGKYIAFLSNREEGQKQVYLMNSEGEGLKRISPQGTTEWVEWFK